MHKLPDATTSPRRRLLTLLIAGAALAGCQQIRWPTPSLLGPVADRLKAAYPDLHTGRFLTIADFREFCRRKHIRIHRCACLDTEAGRDVAKGEDCNLAADLAIFVLSR